MHQFKELIRENKLVVIGAVNDFQNTYKKELVDSLLLI
jgi:hypothetical protein